MQARVSCVLAALLIAAGPEPAAADNSDKKAKMTLARAAKRAGVSTASYLQIAAAAHSSGQGAALKKAGTWRLANQIGTNAAIGRIIVDEMDLPSEAASSGLSISEILQFASDMQKIGAGGALRDPNTWRRVRSVGAAKVLEDAVRGILGIPPGVFPNAGVKNLLRGGAAIQGLGGDPTDPSWWKNLGGKIRQSYGIPKGAAPGASARDLLDSLGKIQAVGGDPSDARIWRDLGRVDNGSMGKRQFIQKWSGGGGGNQSGGSKPPAGGGSRPGLGHDSGGRAGGAPGQGGTSGGGGAAGAPAGTGSTSGAPAAPVSASPDGGGAPAGGNDGTGHGATVAGYAVTQRTSDGGFDLTLYASDAEGNTWEVGTQHFTPDGQGGYTAEDGATAQGPLPEDGGHTVYQDDNGNLGMSADSDDNASGGDSTDSGSGEDDDDEDDNSDDTDDSDSSDPQGSNDSDGGNSDGSDPTGTTGTTPSDGDNVSGRKPTLEQLLARIFDGSGRMRILSPLILTTGETRSKGNAVFRDPIAGLVRPTEGGRGTRTGATADRLRPAGSGTVDPSPDASAPGGASGTYGTSGGGSPGARVGSLGTGLGGIGAGGGATTWTCRRTLIKDSSGNAWCYCPVETDPLTGAPIRQFVPAPLVALSSYATAGSNGNAIGSERAAAEEDACYLVTP